MKRIVSFALAVVLCAGLSLPVLAEGEMIGADIGEISEATGETKIRAETAPESAPDSAPEESAQEEEPVTESEPVDMAPEAPPEPPQEGEPPIAVFSDIPEGHTFFEAIMDCAAKGITSGYTDGTFRSTNSVTCAQFCVMLSRAFYPQQIGWFPNTDSDGQPWFAPNVKVLSSNGLLKDTSFIDNRLNTSVMNQAISRYDMAQLMTNIMAKKGFSATAAQKAEAQNKISDYKNIPSQYQNAVKNVYALGIITGYSNGTFSGNNVMNRGQGCVVIYRMTKYTPAATTTPDVDDSGKPTGNTGNTGTSTNNTGNTGTSSGNTSSGNTGTNTTKEPNLSNGKPITETNVRALLKELQAKYPDGSLYAPVGTKVSTNIYQPLGYSTGSGCAGWAALASDYIFGKTATVRTHKNFTQFRLGDVLSAKNHTVVIIGTEHCPNCGGTAYTTCDSGSACIVNWDYSLTICPVCSIAKYPDGQNPTVITRYPADTIVPYLPYTKGSGSTSSAGTSSSNTNTGTSSGSTTTTTPSTSKPTIQELMAAPCGLCGKTGGGSVINEAQTKKVCSNCANTNRTAMNAYFNS